MSKEAKTKPSDEFLELVRQLTHVREEVAKLKISLLSAKVFLIAQIMPGQIQETLELLSRLETEVEKSDPTRSSRQRVADIVDALQHLRKRGAAQTDS